MNVEGLWNLAYFEINLIYPIEKLIELPDWGLSGLWRMRADNLKLFCLFNFSMCSENKIT